MVKNLLCLVLTLALSVSAQTNFIASQEGTGEAGAPSADMPKATAHTRLDTLREIYDRLEYRTFAYGDLNQMWLITDSYLVRDVLNKLLNSGALRSSGESLSARDRSQLLGEVYDGQVRIIATKRFIDDEIDALEFAGSSVHVDRIHDWLLIRDLLKGPTATYEQIKSRQYAHSDITKRQFDSVPRSTYDLYLHAFNPQIMLWFAGADTGYQRDRYLLMAFGRLGNDLLDLPFWFKSSIVAGLKLEFQDQPSVHDRDYRKFRVMAGIEEPVNFSAPWNRESSPNSLFKDRRLQGSGTSVFLAGTFVPSYQRSYMELGLQVSLAIEEKQNYPATIPDTFYSIRNYVSLSSTWKHIQGIFDVGAGVSWHDLYHYSRATSPTGTLSRIDPVLNNVLPYIELGISQDGSLIQYCIGTQVNYNVSRGYGFFVVKSSLMINNNVGFDLRYFRAMRSDNLPAWHYDNYVALSPVVRINY